MNLCFATQLMLGISGAKYSVNVGPLCSGGSAVRFLSRAQLQGSVTGHCLAAANRKRHSEAVWVQAHVRIRSYEVGAMNRFLGRFTIGFTLWALLAPLSSAAKYIIGQEERAGAYEVVFDEEKTALDLSKDCYPGKVCPPVVIMVGRQVGTIEVSNCHEGVMYTFVNKGDLDAGVVVQHEGGLYGSKGIPQFGVGTCFCYREGNLMCG
ncbi:hypothetical protein AK812_SmicGene29013 [Symbiodinium microadriaticum]|uniref:Uncharacterized protein n=1 Tax=Symbiodinium microadriaticum TaxID=2951 RepID=A0A1Q9D2Z6_SYMMI|nr:hypothetical protein AK812_SmicGene29013 [Symbiodinium microadriaticum]CAE7862547.1 unnamed protein product [Symbiodinium microadriaticum]